MHILVLYQSSACINNIAQRQMAEKGNEQKKTHHHNKMKTNSLLEEKLKKNKHALSIATL